VRASVAVDAAAHRAAVALGGAPAAIVQVYLLPAALEGAGAGGSGSGGGGGGGGGAGGSAAPTLPGGAR
jgi:hypothetical protein